MNSEKQRSHPEKDGINGLTPNDLELMAEKKNLVCISNRCWNTAAKLIMSFPKNERSQMSLVEGRFGNKVHTTGNIGNWHVWIEVNGEIFDPHFFHFDIKEVNKLNSRVEKKWAGDSVAWKKGNDNVESREGSRWNEPEHDWAKMKMFSCRDLDWDNMKEMK